MTKFSASAEHLYTTFILRDVLAKIIPGLILIVSLYMASYSLCLEQATEKILSLPTTVIVLLFIVSWTGGFVVQEVGTWVHLLGSEIAEEGERKKAATKRGLAMAELNATQLQHVERMFVIKEASGNLAVAILLAFALWLVSLVPATGARGFCEWYHWLKPWAFLLLILIALFKRHRRAGDIASTCRDAYLAVMAPEKMEAIIGVDSVPGKNSTAIVSESIGAEEKAIAVREPGLPAGRQAGRDGDPDNPEERDGDDGRAGEVD